MGEQPGELQRLSGPSFPVAGRGKGQFQHTDEGAAFAHLWTRSPAFTFIARVAKAPQGTDNPQYGIAVRAGTGPYDRMVAARYNGAAARGGVVWLLRHGVAHSTHDGSERLRLEGAVPGMDRKQDFWLKAVRRYPSIALFYSTDGQQWKSIAGDFHLALLEQEVAVGLIVTAGGEGNQPVTVAFDQVSFTADPTDVPLTRDSYVEYRPPIEPWEMFLTQADGARGTDNQAFFLLKPTSLAWKDVRAALYTTGSKEILLEGNEQLAYDSGPDKRRKPSAMKEWEGTFEVKNLRPYYQILAHYGIIRIGSPGRPGPTESALQELAKQIGEPAIANLPLLATGESATGGMAAEAANAMPERMIASAPVIIGAAGVDFKNVAALQTPRLYIYGSRDSGRAHHRQVLDQDQAWRQNRALWAAAPMWQGYHRWWTADRLMLPYFLRLVDLRVPPAADFRRGVPELKLLKEEEGYLGLHATWESNYPEVISWKEAAPEQRRGDASWLPDAYTARIWQAFVSQWPRTVIHFPRYDGTGGFGHVNHPDRTNHLLPANEPWNLAASGPMGGDVRVEYFASLRPLKVLKRYRNNPYLVQLEGLEPGLHVIYAITTVDGKREISHPAPVFFQARRQENRR